VRERIPSICFAVILLTNIALGCLTISQKMHLWNKLDGTYECVTPSDLTRIPGFKFTYQKQDSCKLFPKETVSIGLNIFYLYWYSVFGDTADAVLNNLNNLIIEWKVQRMDFENGYRLDGTYVPEGKAVGLAFGKGLIQIFVEEDARIEETSFVHELVHVSINAATGQNHGDPDHEGDKYEGWTRRHTQLIMEVNDALKAIMEIKHGAQDQEETNSH